MKHSSLLLLIALIADVPAFGQPLDSRTTNDSIHQKIPHEIRMIDDRPTIQDRITPGHVPSNIYDAASRPPREIQIIDDRPIVRDFRTAPEAPALTAPQRNAIERMNGMHGILYDALPSPHRRSSLNNQITSTPHTGVNVRSSTTNKHTSPKPPTVKQ
jgi:hypothetical protein